VETAANEMRETGEQDAEAFYRVFYCSTTGGGQYHSFGDATVVPSQYFIRTLVDVMSAKIANAQDRQSWLEGFWGWWHAHIQ
jgi:hypothetical protein